MYLLPLAACFVSSLFNGSMIGRAFGHRGSVVIAITCLAIAFLSSLIIWIEVCFMGCPVSIDLWGSWFNVGTFNANWTLNYDLLTAHMLLTVTGVSFAVHMYAADYMRSDPHQNLFLSYLSLFTAFMLVLVAADNLVLMLVGWEGMSDAVMGGLTVGSLLLDCLDVPLCLDDTLTTTGSVVVEGALLLSCAPLPPTKVTGAGRNKRSIALMGSPFHFSAWLHLLPAAVVSLLHALPVLDTHALDPTHPAVQVVVGLLLGDGGLDTAGGAGNPRIKLDIGYNLHGLACIVIVMSIFTRVGLHRTGCFTIARDVGRGVANSGMEYVYYSMVLNSARHKFFKLVAQAFLSPNSDSSLNRKWIKQIPDDIGAYLSPLCLAVWFVGDGELAEKGKRVNLCSQGFTEVENKKLSNAINQRYGLRTVVWREKSVNHPANYLYYISVPPAEVPAFVKIVLPFLPTSAYYKLPLSVRPRTDA